VSRWCYIVEFKDGSKVTVPAARGFKDAMRKAMASSGKFGVLRVLRHAPTQPFILVQRSVKGVRP
jgi:hypothetical protein